MTPRYDRMSALELIQEQFPEYHPLKALAQLVHLPNLPIGDQIAIHTTLSKYVAPQLKQVDIHAHIDTDIVYKPVIHRFDGSLEEDIAEAEIVEEIEQGALTPEEVFS